MGNNFIFLIESNDGILEIVFKIFSILGVVVSMFGVWILILYTVETYRLRKNSEKQLKFNVRPVIKIKYKKNLFSHKERAEVRWNPLIAVTAYDNLAFNLKIFINDGGQEYVCVSDKLSIIDSLNPVSLSVSDFKPLEDVYKSEYLEFFKHVEGKEWGSLLIYEDINQNKLFTMMYFDKDENSLFETKYLDEI